MTLETTLLLLLCLLAASATTSSCALVWIWFLGFRQRRATKRTGWREWMRILR